MSQPTATSDSSPKPMASIGTTSTTSGASSFKSTTATSKSFGTNAQAKPFKNFGFPAPAFRAMSQPTATSDLSPKPLDSIGTTSTTSGASSFKSTTATSKSFDFGFPAPAFRAMSQPTATSDLSPKPLDSIGTTSTTSGASSFKSTTATSKSFGTNAQAKPFKNFGFPAPAFRAMSQPTATSDLSPKPLDSIGTTSTTSGASSFKSTTATSKSFGTNAQAKPFKNFGFRAPAFRAMSQPTATSDLSPKPLDSIGTTSTTSGASSFKSTTATSKSFGTNAQAKPFKRAQTSGLFGPPAQPSLCGDAGVNTGTAHTRFSSPNTSTGLFGTSNPTPAFGQATKPAPFGSGGSTGTGLFGQAQQPAQQTAPSLFGPSNTTANTSLFGNTSGFTGNNTAGGMTGTVVQFSPLTGSDTMMQNGVTHTISTRHYCISCMKEYEGKSIEELRLEDYIAGRKGQSQGAQTSGLFGSPAQPSLFGNAGVNTSTANTGFGSTTPAFGATSQPAATSGLFAKPMAGFGATATTSSAFPFNSTITTSNPFGANTQAKPFGAAAPAPLFGSTNTTQTPIAGFGTTNTTRFGNFGSVAPNQSIGLFNQNKPSFIMPTSNMPTSSTSTGFGGFGQNTTNTMLFGAKPTGTTAFGTTPSFEVTPAPPFGTATGFGTAPNTGTSSFNSSLKPAGQPGFSFGTTPSTSTGLVSIGLDLGTGTPPFGQAVPNRLATRTNTNINSTNAFGLGYNFGASNKAIGIGLGTIGEGMRVNSSQQNSGATQVHQKFSAPASAPIDDSPLLKNLLPASGKTEDHLKPADAIVPTFNSSKYKIDTNNNSLIAKVRAIRNAQLSKKSLFEGLEEEDPALQEAFQSRARAKRLAMRSKPIKESQPSKENVVETTVA